MRKIIIIVLLGITAIEWVVFFANRGAAETADIYNADSDEIDGTDEADADIDGVSDDGDADAAYLVQGIINSLESGRKICNPKLFGDTNSLLFTGAHLIGKVKPDWAEFESVFGYQVSYDTYANYLKCPPQ